MILIKKNKEPKEWEEYRNTPGVDYQSKPALVDSLLDEQGYICAYCMRRIPCKDRIKETKDGKQIYTQEDHRVEHILSRENHDDLKLDYKNMVICCPGHIGIEDHCDRLKGSKDISFSPMDKNFIDTLSYQLDGSIKSSNKVFDDEINSVLKLNTELLKLNRKNAWNAALNELIKENKENWSNNFLDKHIKNFSIKKVSDDKLVYNPYCGIIIYFLNKKKNMKK